MIDERFRIRVHKNGIALILAAIVVAALGVLIWADLVTPSLASRLAACKAFPNNSTQHVVETTRLFINTPKDIYPDKNISADFETAGGTATAGYISNGGPPGEAFAASPGCWSTEIDFEGVGEVDLKIQSAVEGIPDYFVRFVVGPTQ